MKPRARTATGRLLHYRVNPAPLDFVCAICGSQYKRGRARATNQGQRTHMCSTACRDLAHMLWPPSTLRLQDKGQG